MKKIKQRMYWEELRCRNILLLRRVPKCKRGYWTCTTCGRTLRRKHFNTYAGVQRPDQPCKECQKRIADGYAVELYPRN